MGFKVIRSKDYQYVGRKDLYYVFKDLYDNLLLCKRVKFIDDQGEVLFGEDATTTDLHMSYNKIGNLFDLS